MRQKVFRLLSIIMLLSLIVACTSTESTTTTESVSEESEVSEESNVSEDTEEPISITFWSAPNTTQTVFWQGMADAYMAENPNVTITVSAMPESPSSEAGIQAAIAGGTAPTASENIFIGFGEMLSSSSAVKALDEMPGWEDLIEARQMEKTIGGWEFADGHYYVLPIYSNAMLWGYRIDILQELGIDTAPRTYSEVIALGEAVKEKYSDKVVWARPALGTNTWWERWFDFFMLYYAASDGTPLTSGSDITADNEAAIDVLTFLGNLAVEDMLIVEEVTDPFQTGVEVMDAIGPWAFSGWVETYPELVLNETYVLTTPPVPDDYPEDQPVKTFADAKGIVFYAQATDEETEAMWEFIKWVFSDEQNDLTWLEATSLPPARDDLSTNAAFQDYFEENPQLLAYAAELPYAIPPMAAEHYTEIQVAMGDLAIVPVVVDNADPTSSWNAFVEALAGYIQ